jgi:hypothetical protein
MQIFRTQRTPLAEFQEILATQGSTGDRLDWSKLTLSKIKPVSNVRNTSVTLTGQAGSGIVGTITLNYNRIDISRYYNKVGAVNKKPVIRLSAGITGNKTLTDVIQQINQALGLSLEASGVYRDLNSVSFTVPNKNSSIAVTLVANTNISGLGETSLRLVPGTTLEVEFLNIGAVLANAMPVRNHVPFLNGNKIKNNAGWDISIDTPRTIPDVFTYGIDLTAVLHMASLLDGPDYLDKVSGTGSATIYRIKPSFMTGINAKLAAAGMPTIDPTWVFNPASSSYNTALVYIIKTTDDAKLTASRINPQYSHVLEIPYTALVSAEDLIDTPLYLHFNLLV